MSNEGDLRRSLNRIELEISEVWNTIGEEPALGDDGIAEAMIVVENGVSLVLGRLRKREEAKS